MTRHHDDEEIPPGIRAAIRERRIVDDRREPSTDEGGEAKINIRWSIAVQVIAYIVGLFVIYNTMTARLTTLETQRSLDSQRMERVEAKVDRLLERSK